MSRLGKLPVPVPNGVSVTFTDGVLTVTGPKGTLSRTIRENDVSVTVNDEGVVFTPQDTPDGPALWGTYAAHCRNMVHGVTEGFKKVLEIEGVGYRAEVQGNTLVLNMGYSHPVEMTVPEDVTAAVEKSTITLTSHDPEVLGQFAANVRAVRPPEPYKGKGIRYQGEYIIRKQGKKAV
jgi:large subunit ribosomal protein L6